MEANNEKTEKISANINETEAKKLVEEVYNISTQKVRRLDGFDDLNFHVLPDRAKAEHDKKTKTEFSEHGYVLKVINWKDSDNVEFVNEYINVLLHLSKEGIPCPHPVENKFGNYTSYWTDDKEIVEANELKHQHIIVMLTYLPGELLQHTEFDERFCFSLGQLINKLHKKLQVFNQSTAIINRNLLWSLNAIPEIFKYTYVIKDEQKRSMVLRSLQRFNENVLPAKSQLEGGIIHGDLNEANLLVHKQPGSDPLHIVGVIDLCDMSFSCYLFELAITVTYLSLQKSNDKCEDITAALILGYGRKLTDLEFELFKTCICARLSQSLTLGLYTHSLYPTNDYLLKTQVKGWQLMEKLYNTDNDKFIKNVQTSLENYRNHFASNRT